MANYSIDKEAFLLLLEQFTNDIPFEHRVFKKILNQLPKEYALQLIRDLYYDQVYEGEYFIATHHLFAYEIHYFHDLIDLRTFLNKHYINKQESAITLTRIEQFLDKPLPLAGYYIRKISGKEHQ